ncbi:MAG: hypothetical protein ACK4NW_00460 [Roseinatronobacter sp.]
MAGMKNGLAESGAGSRAGASAKSRQNRPGLALKALGQARMVGHVEKASHVMLDTPKCSARQRALPRGRTGEVLRKSSDTPRKSV